MPASLDRNRASTLRTPTRMFLRRFSQESPERTKSSAMPRRALRFDPRAASGSDFTAGEV